MIFSKQQLFSDDQAITATAISTNIIDLGVTRTPKYAAAALSGDVGKAMVPILVQCTTAFNNLTSLTITIVTGASSTAPATVIFSQVVLRAALVPGFTITVDQLPKGVVGRYLAVNYTVTGTAPSTGNFTAGLTMGNHTNDI